MASFLGEIKRRKVFQVAAVYLVVAWLLVQIVATIEAPLRLPEWVDTLVIVLLAVGFPVAIILSWAFDLTSAGVEKTSAVTSGKPEPPETMATTTGLAVNLAVIGSLAALLVVVAIYVFGRDESTMTADGIDLQSQAPAPADNGPEILPNSVAVIPFDNMSADPEDAYFAAGLHDEILNQLAKLGSLNVIARTSVMQYAGVARPITEIARELNVGTIMEGSVSYAAGRVAIRAQLIDAETGVHLWSDSYNREFSDVFAIQADIAKNVADALEAEFSQSEREIIEAVPTDAPEAYALYLKALSIGHWSSNIPLAMQHLDEAIAVDPEFALAYAEKAVRYAWSLQFSDDSAFVAEMEEQARSNALKALTLDADTAYAHLALALVEQGNSNWAEAERAFARALEISPGDTEVLNRYGRFVRYTGDYEEAIRLLERLRDLDPNAVRNQLGIAYRYARQLDKAAAAFRAALAINPSSANARLHLGYVEIGRGNIAEGLQNLEIAEGLFPLSPFRAGQLAIAYAQANQPNEVSRLQQALQRFEREGSGAGAVGDASWAMMYLALGDFDQAYERLEAAINNTNAASFVALSEIAANPWVIPVLEEEPRFVELRRRIHASD